MPRKKDYIRGERNEEEQEPYLLDHTDRPFTELPTMENVGEISVSGNIIHWTIKDFFKKPKSAWLYSPHFWFADKDWTLHINPTGCKRHGSKGWFEIGLINRSDSDASFFVRLGFVKLNGKEITSFSPKRDDNQEEFNAWRLIHRLAFKNSIAPNGTVFAFCEIRKHGDVLRKHGDALRKHGDALRKHGDACGVEASALEKSELGVLACCDQYKNMILGGQACDATITVKHQVFPVHKSVLRAHSPFFSRTFDETQDGVICMEDCDAEVFQQLLLFVYSGKLEDVPSKSLPRLYCAAVEYDFADLKQLCVDSMKTSLCEETVCDVIHLAKSHGESNLLKRAMNFFVRYAEIILATTEWQNFKEENAAEANLLLIETLKLRPYKAEGIVPNEVSEMIYRKMVALTLHPNNQ